MNDVNKSLIQILETTFSYAVLEEDDRAVRILISPEKKKEFIAFARKNGWKKKKDRSGDLYLYGMEHFLYYSVNGVTLTVCFQIACRSTLNGEWVPLDRMINIGALERRALCKKKECHILCAEDEINYLLAKCVYTQKRFDEESIQRIEEDLACCDKEMMEQKLAMVFFRFAPRMKELVQAGEYDSIIDGLWRFADY